MDVPVEWSRGWLLAVVGIALAALPSPLPSQRSIPAAVELYEAGSWRRALDRIDPKTLTAAQFTSALDDWVSAGDASSKPRRRLVAAAFGLDAAWSATRPGADERFVELSPSGTAPLTDRRSLGVIASWAARQMALTGTAPAAERVLWLAMVGMTEDCLAWSALQADILPRARKRLLDEPRLRLATVVASANIELGLLHFFSRTWGHNLNSSVLREENLPSTVTRRIPVAIRSFEALLAEPSLAGEVELRIGYLELRRRHWSEALRRFDAARTKTADTLLLATADYFAGWVHEQVGQPDQAIVAYRRALVLAPTMRNLATRLAALLFLRDERADAHAVLDRALNARPLAFDLLLSLDRGDSRFVGDWLATARQRLLEASSFQD